MKAKAKQHATKIVARPQSVTMDAKDSFGTRCCTDCTLICTNENED
jgi:hypothetical protein